MGKVHSITLSDGNSNFLTDKYKGKMRVVLKNAWQQVQMLIPMFREVEQNTERFE